MAFIVALAVLAVGAAIVLDFFDKLPFENAVGRFIGMTILPHVALLAWYGGKAVYKRDEWGGLGFTIGIVAPICLFAIYFMIRLAVKPYRVKFDKTTVNTRVRAMYGGRILLKFTAISLFCNTVYYILDAENNFFWDAPEFLRIADTVISSVIILGYGWNGILRIVLLCRRLGIVKRVVYFFLLPVPIVGIFVLISMYRTAKAEYDYETTRKICESQRIESQVCKTKYPILLVHGLGFRDWKYFNYWGRIPAELIRNGAAIYYGHQEACATVVTNAEHIRKKVLEIVEETGYEKVNIIAHSKGGLDSRYAIAKLGIEDYVATLTTVGTPHHGSQVTDLANKLPDSFYRKVADFADRRFKKLGDGNPDFYTACHQLNTEYAEQFNEEIKDSEKVYYQSYASVMKNSFSFDILGFTWLLLSKYGRNDGLVTEESAKWGNFRGVYESKRIRGISHGDTIDLKREDYKGYDPREAYVEIVSELKDMGF